MVKDIFNEYFEMIYKWNFAVSCTPPQERKNFLGTRIINAKNEGNLKVLPNCNFGIVEKIEVIKSNFFKIISPKGNYWYVHVFK